MLLNKPAETIKFILEHLQAPEMLDNHPWAMSAFTKEYLIAHPEAKELNPGRQLASAVAGLFLEWMPSSPPRQGKRLDNRWGEYGLLAAQYVVPFLSGTASPRSLKDAWGYIDQAIAFMVAQKLKLNDQEIAEQYQLLAREPEAANSTISDWHRKGIERFGEFVLLREKHIESEAIKKAKASNSQSVKTRSYGWLFKLAGILLLAALLTGSIWGYFKAQRMMEITRSLRQELQTIQALELSTESINNTAVITNSLENIDRNLYELDKEARPYLWLTRSLGWIPIHGGDIENSEALLDMALSINDSLQETYRGISPFIGLLGERESIEMDNLIAKIKESQPALQAASQSLRDAKDERASILVEKLSPQVRGLVLEKIDPALMQLEKGLVAASALPGLLGAGSDGPKTYLLILQNEDELRATGGFLTAVGSVVIRDGEIINMVFENSYDIDDLSKPYPPPPWQLTEYMDASIYLLRDSNWSPDFPTTAAWAEYLYAYTRSHSVDGILAIDQYAIAKILETTGPVKVTGYEQPITSENILETMRASKVPQEGEIDSDWDRKDFIGELAPPILEKIMSGQGFSWEGMIKTITKLLDEKHIILQFDDENITNLLIEQGWNGQVVPFAGDYLMVVDSNIGFSKTNAIIEQNIDIEIDIADLAKPRKNIKITYFNPLDNGKDCGEPGEKEDRYYPIIRCYGNYLRIYSPEGSLLTAATPHPVPAEWTVNGQFVPARVDTLTDDLDGFSVFGTYFFVPSGDTLSTSFALETPASVITQQADDSYVYRLKIQKQPGTIAIPISLRLILPDEVIVAQTPKGFALENGTLTGKFQLREDIIIEIVFSY